MRHTRSEARILGPIGSSGMHETLTINQQSIVSPHDQKVTFVELFFDLVFVFCVTQVVGLLHDGITWPAVGQVVLVFWLVWWAWTQFTWALNAADTTHHLVELATLLATAVAFFMAVTIPRAFHGGGAAFAVTYVLVRGLGLIVYGWVAAAADRSQHAAVRKFSIVSLGGLAAVLVGGFVGGTLQYWIWGFAILLDVIAAAVGAQSDSWNLHPEHFAERHGLIVIIALGETLIVAAGGVTGAAWNQNLLGLGVLAVATTGAFWWTYFVRAKPRLDGALESCGGATQSELARDCFSLIHFPMLCGVVAYAAAIEAAVAHPNEPFPLPARLALAAGLLLFVGGMVVAMWRATRQLLLPRLVVISAIAGALVFMPARLPLSSLAVAFVGVAIVAVLEQRSFPPRAAAAHT
jgi:low temperature requirement protein LtrA